MFESFLPLFSLVVIYLVIAVTSKAAKKASDARKATFAARSAAPADTDTVPAAAPAPEGAGPFRPRELQPTIRVTEHDDSVYQGSMNTVTGEGYDPCHEDQLSSLDRPEPMAEPVPAAVPGLRLNWTGDEIVRGIVISEILKRKGA